MGLLQAAMLAALERVPCRVQPVLELDNSAGVTLRYAGISAPFSSVSLGHYEPRIRSWGRSTRAIGDSDGALRGRTQQITIDDADRSFSAHVYRLNKRPARKKYVAQEGEGTTASDIYLAFSGIVDGIERSGANWIITLRQDDLLLKSVFPRASFNRRDFPNLHPTAEGQPVPIIYGKHDTGGGVPGGMVKAYYVDTTGNGKWIVCGHYAKSIDRVYVKNVSTDWTLKTLTTDYTVDYPIIGGQQYTRITMVTSPGTEPEMTIDVQGVESTGTGTSGTLLRNPATVLKHFLTNFVFGEWRFGAWLADSTRLASTYFTTSETWGTSFSPVYHLASRWIGDQQRSGEDELREWCRTFRLLPFWTAGGKLGVLPWDHRIQGSAVYPSAWLQAGLDVIDGAIQPVFDPATWLSRVITRHIARYAEGETFHMTTQTNNYDSSQAVLQEIEARWLDAIIGDSSEAFGARDGASRHINRFREILPDLVCRLPLWAIDWELLTDVGVTWDSGPREDGFVGWGEKKWERRLYRLAEITTDDDAMECEARFQDVTNQLTSFWAYWKTLRSTQGREDGTIFISLGSLPSTTRASNVWLSDPGGQVVSYGNDLIPISADGLLIERTATNDALRGSFVSGLTGLPASTGSGTITADTTDLFFGTGSTGAQISGNVLKMTAGNPNTVETVQQMPDTASFAANTRVVVSADHKDDTGAILVLRVQRLFDNNWWRDSDATWQAASQDISLPERAAWDGSEIRDRTKVIDVGANATALRIFFVQTAGGTASRVNRIGHLQTETQRWASSRVVSNATAVTRSATTFKIANDQAESKELWNLLRGTIELSWRPLWDSADLAAGSQFYLLSLEYDASNKWEAYYDKDTASYVFKVTASGSAFSTTIAATITKGTSERVALRYTSDSEDELDYASQTLSIFRNGVRGTDATYTTPTKAGSDDVFFGCKTGSPATGQLNGAIAWCRFSPLVFNDAVIAARSLIAY